MPNRVVNSPNGWRKLSFALVGIAFINAVVGGAVLILSQQPLVKAINEVRTAQEDTTRVIADKPTATVMQPKPVQIQVPKFDRDVALTTNRLLADVVKGNEAILGELRRRR